MLNKAIHIRAGEFIKYERNFKKRMEFSILERLNGLHRIALKKINYFLANILIMG